MLFSQAENWKTLQNMYDKKTYSYQKYWQKFKGINSTLAMEIPTEKLMEVIVDYATYLVKNSSGHAIDGQLKDVKLIIKYAYYIYWLEVEINNGGFDQYYFNSTGYNAKETVDALVYFNLPMNAKNLKNSLDLILTKIKNHDFKKLQIDRELPLEEIFDDLSKCTDEFYKYEEDISGKINAFINAKRIEIVTK